jgi:hypothetical protein
MVNQALVARVQQTLSQAHRSLMRVVAAAVKQTNPHLAQEVLGAVVLAVHCLQMEIPEQPI